MTDRGVLKCKKPTCTRVKYNGPTLAIVVIQLPLVMPPRRMLISTIHPLVCQHATIAFHSNMIFHAMWCYLVHIEWLTKISYTQTSACHTTFILTSCITLHFQLPPKFKVVTGHHARCVVWRILSPFLKNNVCSRYYLRDMIPAAHNLVKEDVHIVFQTLFLFGAEFDGTVFYSRYLPVKNII